MQTLEPLRLRAEGRLASETRRGPEGAFYCYDAAMTKLYLLIVALVLCILQMYWPISAWRKDGFIAALRLFAFGGLTVSMVAMSELIEQF